MAAARSARFELLLLDLALPDMGGLELVSALQGVGITVPFVVISGWATIATTVAAMKLGAIDVVEKPVDMDQLLPRIAYYLCGAHTGQGTTTVRPERKRVDDGVVCTVADRWARHVRAAAESAGDLRTIAAWARFVGVSKTSLSDMCRLLNIRPRDARDLSRVLRIVAQSTNISTEGAALLDVCDQRTLEKLLARAGLLTATGYVSMKQLLERQRFVPVHNVGMIRLAELVGER